MNTSSLAVTATPVGSRSSAIACAAVAPLAFDAVL
jgi:hypothetical protein